MRLFNTLLIIFLANFVFAQSAEKELTLHTSSGNLAGTLLCPESDKKVPMVLFISGSGPTDRDGNNPMMKNNSLKMLAEGLFTENIASLRYDKRGIAKSADSMGKEEDLKFDNFVQDTEAWVDTLSLDERFSEIVVLGHSEGSTIGMIAARKKTVSKYISVAGPGSKASDIIRDQLKVSAPAFYESSLPVLEKLEAGETVEDYPPLLESLFRPSIQPYLISWFKYDPQVEIAKLDKPVLIVQGTTDIQVSVSEAEKLVNSNKNAELIIIEQMNHVLKKAEADRMKNMETYSNPDLPLIDGLLEEIVDFIKHAK